MTEYRLNLNDLPTAQLAALIDAAQDMMRARIAADLPERVGAAILAETQRVATDQEIKEADREARRGKVLDAFTFAKVEVPALDLSDITSLDEIVSAKFRSPYNKVLNRAKRDILRPDEATYGRLAEIHEEFLTGAPAEPAAKAPEPVKAEPQPEPEPEPEPVEVVVAEVEPEAKAKVVNPKQVAALMAVRGITEEAATRVLLAL